MLFGRIKVIGSLTHWQIRRPIIAFQNPTTIQGKVNANSPKIMIRITVGIVAARV
jgi:hypothetical protein